MRKLTHLFIALLILLTSTTLNLYAQEKSLPSALAPAGTEALFVISNLKVLYQYLPLQEIFPKEKKNESKAEKKQKIALTVQEYREKLGLDTERKVGISISDINLKNMNNPLMNLVLYIPVNEEKFSLPLFKKTLSELLKKDISFENVQGILKARVKKEDLSVYFAVKNNYLIATLNPSSDSVLFIQSVLKSKSSLSEDPMYTEVKSKMNTEEEFFLYMNGKKIFKHYWQLLGSKSGNQTEEILKSMGKKYRESIKDYRGIGISVDCNTSDLTINTLFNLKEGSPLLNIYEGIKWDKNYLLGFSKFPLFLLSAGFNPQEYYKLISGLLPDNFAPMVDQQLRHMSDTYGIDLEKDIINNMAGNFNAGIYDGSSLSPVNPMAFVLFNLKDPEKMRKILLKLTKTFPKGKIEIQSIGNESVYQVNAGMFKFNLAVIKDQCVLTLSKSMLLNIMNASWDGSFTEKLKDKTLAQNLKAEKNTVYLNFDEVRMAIKNFQKRKSGFSNALNLLLARYRYLYADSSKDQNALTGSLLIKSRVSKPFFIGLFDSINDFNKRKQNFRRNRLKR